MFDAHVSIKDQDRLESRRSSFDIMWQECAELYLPRQADFQNQFSTPGEPRHDQIYDEYPMQALAEGKAIAIGFTMPRGSMFQGFAPPDDELGKLAHVRKWYQQKTRALYKYRHDPLSGFVQQTDESMASLFAFGNQAMSNELRYDPITKKPVGIRYRSEHIGPIYIEENFQGMPDLTHKKFRWTAKKALQKFGKKMLERAPKVLEAATGTPEQQNREFEFIKKLCMNMNLDPDRLDYRGKPYVGGYISCEDKEFFDKHGWNSRPLNYSRFEKSPTEDYGRGPGPNMLPATKALQEIAIDLMAGAEMSLMPPLGGPDDSLDMLINYGAREFTPGATDYRGNKLVQKLFDIGEFEGPLQIQAKLREIVDRGCFRHLMSADQELKSHVTDAQIMEHRYEKGTLLAPLSTQETEWLSPLLERDVDLMHQMGEFEDMPGEVIEAGGEKAIVYDNPLNRALKSEEVAGFFRISSQMTAMAQYDDQVMPEFRREFPLSKVLPWLAERNNVPASIQATEDEKEASKKQEDQALAQKDALDTAEQLGSIAEKFEAEGAAASGQI